MTPLRTKKLTAFARTTRKHTPSNSSHAKSAADEVKNTPNVHAIHTIPSTVKRYVKFKEPRREKMCCLIASRKVENSTIPEQSSETVKKYKREAQTRQSVKQKTEPERDMHHLKTEQKEQTLKGKKNTTK